MATDNAASRLYDLLTKGKAYKAESSCRQVWGELLGTSDQAVLIARLGRVMAMPQAILEAIEEQHPGFAQHHVYWVAELSAAFGQQNLEGPWQTFKGHISNQSLSAIAIAATSLAGSANARQLSANNLSTLQEQVDALGKLIVDSDISPDIRRFLIRQVHRMKVAIDEYWISGGEPIMEVVEATFGHLGITEAGRTAVATPAGQKIANGLAVIANAVSVASGLPPLLIGPSMQVWDWAKEAAKQLTE
ncbi:hypothetical protein GGR77_001813 [Xanthomonas translucens]